MEHQLYLRGGALAWGPAALSFSLRVVGPSLPLTAAGPGLGGVTGGGRVHVGGGGVMRDMRARVCVVLSATEGGVIALLLRLPHTLRPGDKQPHTNSNVRGLTTYEGLQLGVLIRGKHL